MMRSFWIGSMCRFVGMLFGALLDFSHGLEFGSSKQLARPIPIITTFCMARSFKGAIFFVHVFIFILFAV